jgi:hypothetical protein
MACVEFNARVFLVFLLTDGVVWVVDAAAVAHGEVGAQCASHCDPRVGRHQPQVLVRVRGVRAVLTVLLRCRAVRWTTRNTS